MESNTQKTASFHAYSTQDALILSQANLAHGIIRDFQANFNTRFDWFLEAKKRTPKQIVKWVKEYIKEETVDYICVDDLY